MPCLSLNKKQRKFECLKHINKVTFTESESGLFIRRAAILQLLLMLRWMKTTVGVHPSKNTVCKGQVVVFNPELVIVAILSLLQLFKVVVPGKLNFGGLPSQHFVSNLILEQDGRPTNR